MGTKTFGSRLAALRFCLVLMIVLGLAAPASYAGAVASSAPRVLAQGSVPRFDPGPCDFPDTTNLAQGMDVRCGWLTVPEEHANPTGSTIQLAVAVIKSSAPSPDPVPVVILQGGPGGSTIDTYLQIIPTDPRLKSLNHDIILFDQRGTLYTKPSLVCSEVFDENIRVLNMDITPAESNKLYVDALRQCYTRLSRAGTNLSAFDTLENAADVDALRQALGYDQINLYGVSYGTLVALDVIRTFPQGLRSVTIDSVVPPQINSITDQPQVINHGLETMFAGCAADPGCNRAYPNLKDVFYAQVERLNAKKAPIQVQDFKTGKVYPALLDGSTFLYVMIQMLYSTDLLPLFPRTVYQVRAGNYSTLEKIMANVVFDRSMSEGMYYSVMCAEEGGFDPAKVNLAGLPGPLLSEEKDSMQQFADTCAFWNVQPLAAVANQPVQSDVPTLVLAGVFDPVTPPSYAEQVAKTLTRSFFVTFPAGGHGAVGSGACQDGVFTAFLADPTRKPDTTCVEQQKMIYSTPGALVPFPKLLSLLSPQGADLALLVLYGLGVLFLLTALPVYIIAWLVGLFRTPAPRPVPGAIGEYAPQIATPTPSSAPLYRLGRWLAVLAGGMLLVFAISVVGIAVQMSLANDYRILFGLPGSARPLFLLPLLSLICAVLMLLGAFQAWGRGAGSSLGRVYFTLLTLAGIACVAVLGVWGAITALFMG